MISSDVPVLTYDGTLAGTKAFLSFPSSCINFAGRHCFATSPRQKLPNLWKMCWKHRVPITTTGDLTLGCQTKCNFHDLPIFGRLVNHQESCNRSLLMQHLGCCLPCLLSHHWRTKRHFVASPANLWHEQEPWAPGTCPWVHIGVSLYAHDTKW